MQPIAREFVTENAPLLFLRSLTLDGAFRSIQKAAATIALLDAVDFRRAAQIVFTWPCDVYLFKVSTNESSRCIWTFAKRPYIYFT